MKSQRLSETGNVPHPGPELPRNRPVWWREKAPAAVFSLLVIGAVLCPITENWKAQPQDSFPLSFYPMFSKKRGATVQVTYLVGMDKRGNEQPIRYTYAGTGGLNQVRMQLNSAVRQGKATPICRKVALRIARKKTGPLAEIDTVAMVTGTYRVDDYFAGKHEPQSLQVETLCKVTRPHR
jgi:hypothetical protein